MSTNNKKKTIFAHHKKLSAVAERTANSVLITDAERRVEWVNPAFTAQTGYALDEVRGLAPRDFLCAPENDASVFRTLDDAYSRGTGVTCELMNRTKGGRTYWVEIDSQPVHDEDGKLTGFVTIETDINQRKLAEQRLREASLFGTMLEDSLNEIYVFDFDTLKFIDVNRGARENLGYSIEELREMTAVDIKPDVSPEQFAELIGSLRSGAEKKIVFETRHQRKDGSLYDVEVHLQLTSGDAPRFVAFILDITRRKADDRKLREASLFGKMIEDSLNEIYVLEPRSLRFIDVNRGGRTNLGYSLDELRNMTIRDINQDLSTETRMKLAARLEKGDARNVHFETRHRRKDGSYYDAEVHLYQTSDDDPRLIAFILDITGRKQAEAEAEAARTRLSTAIETLADGFVLYDADDRLVICNERYREIYPHSAAAMVPGANFEEILRYGLERGEYADADGREEEWLAQRLEAHRAADSTIEQQLSDGRWLRIVERRTPDGGRVGLRIDITEQLESRERAERAEQRLVDAIKALPAAFWLYDEEDRLVMYNDNYKGLFPGDTSFIRPGVQYEEVVRHGIRYALANGREGTEDEIVAEIMADREGEHYEREYQLADGRWIRSFNELISDGGHVGFGIDITEARVRQDKLRHAAQTDPLTGLANRRGLSDHLDFMARQANENTRVAIMHIDLDKFKAVNDAIGHDAGDHVLQHCAEVLRKATRDDDLVARVGGDEFVVVCANANRETDIAGMASRLVGRLSSPIPYGDKSCHIGASIGIAFWQPAIEPDAQGRLTDADIALQQSKTKGRGRFHFFEDSMRSRALLSARLAQDIFDGLAGDEFEPFLQPQFDLASGRLIGFEALIRWHHPGRGLLAPGEFLFAAEEANLMDALDQRMLERSCAVLPDLVAAGIDDPRISINMSGTRLGDPKIVERILATTASFGVEPRQLILEILETTLLDERSAHVDTNLRRLVDAGFALELDDFGTGHTAIANLRKYPLERIKIDRSLVAGIDRDVDLVTITSAITNLAKSLGLKVLAEGVESEAELEVLRHVGCTCVQGYLFSHPMPVDCLLDWLRDRDPGQAEAGKAVNF